MTNLQRLTGKIFGETATATGDDPQIGQFGSALNGTYVGTTDVATIQGLPAWSNGFIDSVTPNEQFPPLPEMTGFGKVLSYQTAYTLQKGVPEWDPGTTYYTGDFCKGIGEGKLYVSKIDLNINNDLTDTNSWEEFSSGGGYEVGDIIIRNTPTNDAGKHLLDGTLIQYGSYSAFVDYIADLYNNTPVENVYNVNIVGSLTNDNGVLSGFAGGVYATIKEVPYSTADSIEILLKTTTGTLDTSNYKCFYSPVVSNCRGVNLQINPSNQIMLFVSSNAGSSWDIVDAAAGTTTLQSDTQYYFKYVYTGTNHILYMSTTGAFAGEETTEVNVTNSGKPSNSTVSLGLHAWSPNQNNFYWRGSIDLNESYININGKRWWSGKTEKRAGFLTEDDWQTSVTTYGVCGKFVYDSVNNTVRLPKITGFIEGTTDVTALGDLIEAGLPQIPDHRHYYYYSEQPNGTGQPELGNQKYGPTQTEGISYIEPSNIYGKSDTVQPQAIKVLYYIVIATSTKTDIQVDIDEIATDLNGKADVDLTNVNNSGTSRGAGWAMPSSTYINLTLGASGSTYTAPANGWVSMVAVGNQSATWIHAINNTSGAEGVSQGSGRCCILLPILKNESFSLDYGYVLNWLSFKFIYAQGSESEAQ
ncbi:hypothetical protein [Faecalibacillus faecis]|uniref:hypothetical protein n=1 Tax=Faecalibacillus faecis TaxID=1982628 RepID=UPI00386F606F